MLFCAGKRGARPHRHKQAAIMAQKTAEFAVQLCENAEISAFPQSNIENSAGSVLYYFYLELSEAIYHLERIIYGI